MKKFEKVVELNGCKFENKFIKFIFDNLDNYLSGDWGVYKNGDVVIYNIDLLEKCEDWEFNFIDDWNECIVNEEDKIDLGELKEYVGEGICFIDKNWSEDRCWYNVEFDGDELEISYVVDESLL
jgi:hypothetical protein